MGLINTLENPGEFDALTSLRKGEPYFVLVGRDRLAPPLVRDWADRRRRMALMDNGAGEIDREELETELRKCSEAEDIAEAMAEYKRGAPTEEPAQRVPITYTGYVESEDQAKARTLSRQQYDARSAVNNAVGELTDLLAMMPGREADEMGLLASIDVLRILSDALTPARPGIEKTVEAAA